MLKNAFIVPDGNRYFQYKAFFETENASYTPALSSVTVDYTATTAEKDAFFSLFE